MTWRREASTISLSASSEGKSIEAAEQSLKIIRGFGIKETTTIPKIIVSKIIKDKIVESGAERIEIRVRFITINPFSRWAWQALMAVLFIPFYIKFMGVEAYGLIGIFATLLAIFSLLDMGLASTLTREMARLSVIAGKEQEMRNLVRTLEVIYWGFAISIRNYSHGIIAFHCTSLG